jgi:hypothetical protein
MPAAISTPTITLRLRAVREAMAEQEGAAPLASLARSPRQAEAAAEQAGMRPRPPPPTPSSAPFHPRRRPWAETAVAPAPRPAPVRNASASRLRRWRRGLGQRLDGRGHPRQCERHGFRDGRARRRGLSTQLDLRERRNGHCFRRGEFAGRGGLRLRQNAVSRCPSRNNSPLIFQRKSLSTVLTCPRLFTIISAQSVG